MGKAERHVTHSERALQELFNAFACGGRVVLAAPGMEKDTQALARLISAQGVTNCSCVPSQLEVLLMASASTHHRFACLTLIPGHRHPACKSSDLSTAAHEFTLPF